MFGILTAIKQLLHPQELVYINAQADTFFTTFLRCGTPNPKFKPLLRQNEQNPESVDRDSAHLLYYLAKSINAKKCIEVGIYHGAGSLHLAQAISENGGGELHLVDMNQEYLDDVVKKITPYKYKTKVFAHCGKSDSPNVLKKVPKSDLIFLDADHTYNAVKEDFKNYWPLLKKNGILIIHDTVMWPGARRYANELSARGLKITTIATSGGAGISFVRKTHV